MPTTTRTTTAPPGLADLAASWGRTLTAEHKSRGTVRAYLGAAAAFTAWHETAAPGMPVTAASLDRRTAAAFLADLLAAEGETDGDLLAGMKPPKLDAAAVDSVSDGELAALIAACHAPPGADRWEVFEALRDEAAVRLMADTGMRAGETVALTVADVDLDRRLVTIGRAKGGKHRVSVFGPDAARALDRYVRRARRGHRLAAGGRLFLGTSGRGWTYSALRGALARRAEAAGIAGFHPHRLRHTAASAALDAGISEGDVMANMGWSSHAMLRRYTLDTAQRRAAESFTRYFDGRGR